MLNKILDRNICDRKIEKAHTYRYNANYTLVVDSGYDNWVQKKRPDSERLYNFKGHS